MSEAVETASYTIDELAALTRVPSRTIRFYQSAGALPKPDIRGRVAYYGPAHKERLELIARLQDRGLQIKAIREVLYEAEKGAYSVEEWLGLHERLASPWEADSPKILSEAELATELAGHRPGLAAELLRARVMERRGDAYLVDSPQLFSLVLRMEKVGVPVDLTREAAELMKKHLGRLAGDLTDFIVKRADALGPDLHAAYEELRPVSMEAVRIMFAREMERAIRKANDSGAAAALSKKKHLKRR
jgi:DNA-binding transcriptional MerR regulator